MKKNLLLLGLSGLIMILAITCAPKQVAAPSPERIDAQLKGEEKVTVKSASGGWEAQWEKAVQGARKEGVVVVYSSSVGPAIKEASPLISKKYGFRIDLISGRGAELTQRLISERKAGLYLADVLLTGMNNFANETKPAGAADILEPALILPEVADPKLWFGGKLPWGDPEHRVLMSYAYPNTNIAINTDLVKPDEIKSYRDLLNPKWKGKIIMNDPTVAGTGLKSFSVLAYAILDLDFFRHLARQEPVIIRDQRTQVDWLAKGKYSILVFPRTAPMTEYKEAGAPVAFVSTVEGTYLSVGGGNITLVNKAPHPNAAMVFINWFLSKEGQIFITNIDGLQSARLDVPTEKIDPMKVRQTGAKYFLGADSEEWLARDPEYVKAATEIFGHLIR